MKRDCLFTGFSNCSVTIKLKGNFEWSIIEKKSIDINVNELYEMTVIHVQGMERLEGNQTGEKVRNCSLNSAI